MLRSSLVALLLALCSPVVVAQTPCHAENDGPIFEDNTSMGGPWVAIPFTPAANFAATYIEVFTGEVVGNSTLMIYTHDNAGNQPGVMLETGSWTISSTNSWQGATLNFPTFLAAGVNYWLVWIPVGGDQASIDSTVPGLGQLYRASFDNGLSWGGPFQDNFHHWKFRIFGTCNSTPPVAYCTAGTTTNGCAASIAATGNPNVSHTASCQISITNVEGQKAGIVFYGLTQTVSPWCSLGGGSSLLCVKAPTTRTGVQNSGGTINQCNGTMVLDWNAFQIAHPLALGAPWTIGEKAYVQGWFRDPTACKTTNLSNALEMTYMP